MAWTSVQKPATDDWAQIPKPSEASILTFQGGEPIGLLMALTYTNIVPSVLTGWTDIQKTNQLDWTSIPKPTDIV